MTAGADRVLDLKYGRQGGRRTKHTGFKITGTCTECDTTMICNQPGRHWHCSPTCNGCHRPIGPQGQNCHCTKNASR